NPANAAERLELAFLCTRHKKLYVAAIRWSTEASLDQPKLADNLEARHRYTAACAAALAGCGQGEDAANLPDQERCRLRKQALDWLRADLVERMQLLDHGTGQTRAQMLQWLERLQQDSQFAGVRGPAALVKLPEAERAEWTKLWENVEMLLKKVVEGENALQ